MYKWMLWYTFAEEFIFMLHKLKSNLVNPPMKKAEIQLTKPNLKYELYICLLYKSIHF